MPSSKLVLDFKDFATDPKESGMKFVVFRIDQPGANAQFEFGFCEWDGVAWADMNQPRVTVKVIKWCDLPSATNLMF